MGRSTTFWACRSDTLAQGLTPAERHAAYACDVTYVTAKEAGFDFLRDQTWPGANATRAARFHYAIVDEADSILIDEARVAVVIAGRTKKTTATCTVSRTRAHAAAPRRLRDRERLEKRQFNTSGLNRLQTACNAASCTSNRTPNS